MQRMFGRALVVVAATFIVAGFGVVSAQNTNSSNYQITEAKFGSGATLGDCSENYCAKASLGDNVVGSAASANYTARFGQIVSDEPLLEVITEPGSSNLGDLSPERTATATRYIKVRSYLSDGYVIRVNGGSPTQGDKPLNALTTPTASQAGVEQFGINFVKNTQPDVGADLVHVPSNQFSFGEVLDGYDAPDLFKYVDGEAVARSTQSSGQTDYTMTMIVNVSNLTLAGQYQAAFSAVVIPLF